MEVTPGLRSIENRVIGKYDGSRPTRVTSVPCNVVTNGKRRFSDIWEANQALME
jgi:hypothetical protein